MSARPRTSDACAVSGRRVRVWSAAPGLWRSERSRVFFVAGISRLSPARRAGSPTASRSRASTSAGCRRRPARGAARAARSRSARLPRRSTAGGQTYRIEPLESRRRSRLGSRRQLARRIASTASGRCAGFKRLGVRSSGPTSRRRRDGCARRRSQRMLDLIAARDRPRRIAMPRSGGRSPRGGRARPRPALVLDQARRPTHWCSRAFATLDRTPTCDPLTRRRSRR